MQERAYRKSVVARVVTEYGPIKLSELSDTTGFSTREVKKIVQELRHDGYSICSTTERGYWTSEDAEDIDLTIRQIQARIKTSMKTIEDLEKIKESFKNESD